MKQSQNKRYRSIYIMHEHGLKLRHLEAVISGIQAVLRSTGVERRINIRNFGAWRNRGWLKNETLTDWNSVDWYIARAREASRNNYQLNGEQLLYLLEDEPWQEKSPHYDVVVTHSDIYSTGCNFVIGLAIQEFGTVISTSRFAELNARQQSDCIVTETMHEIGHVFGLIPAERTDNVERSLGLHCANKCIMRQGLSVPADWLKITKDRLKGYAFCPTCQRDLVRFFNE